MDSYELSRILCRFRDMVCATRAYHLSDRLDPVLTQWGAAPEKRKDNRSDIYLLGIVLFRQLPDDLQVSQEATQILEHLLKRTLSSRPQGRYSCCEELLADLDQALTLLRPAQMPPDSS